MKTNESLRFQKAKSHFDLPMLFLAIVLLGILIIREVVDLPENIFNILLMVDWLIWLVFAFELVILTTFSKKKAKYLMNHWYDVLIVAIPMFRLTRLLRIFQFIPFIEATESFVVASQHESIFSRSIPLVFKIASNVKLFIVEHKFHYLFVILAMTVLFLGSLASIFESGAQNSNIKTVYDGMWWSVETVTTVGYGDRFPITWSGRFIGILLMAFGITSFSLLTANIASFLVGEKEDQVEDDIEKHLDRLEKKIDDLGRSKMSKSK